MTGERGANRDYILGTADQETLRLGLQHAAWSAIAHECWNRAGVRAGDSVIDVGAGPGYAAFDLAEIVGPQGHVTAVERSARFVDAGRAMARGRGLHNVEFIEADLMIDELPGTRFDVAWCRWVASFVDSPAALVSRIARSVRPGGVVAFHEYVDYASWKFSPALPMMEEYVGKVMASWREAGGEPDVAMSIPPLLIEHGFVIEHAEPRVFCSSPDDGLWTWIATFVESNLRRMVELGAFSAEWADQVRAELRHAQADPGTIMLTPMVLEIVARRIHTT